MATTWICSVCYREHPIESAPAGCKGCGASAKMFVRKPDAGPAIGEELIGLPASLEEARDRARKRLRGICAVYPRCDGNDDRVCNREAYGKPIGLGGVGTGSSFAANVAALDAVRLHTRLVGPHVAPETRLGFLGLQLAMPVMGSSTAGLGRYTDEVSEYDFCLATVRGCQEAGTISWRGDTYFYTLDDHPGLRSIEAAGGHGIPIFKPRHQDVLVQLFECAARLGCPAVGVDLDGCGSTIMARHGQPVFRKRQQDLEELVRATSLPVIFKGIMHPDDAEACVAAGAAVIAVSNHGGRVLDGTPGVAAVLPGIAARVKGRALITADGGVRTGYDVLRLLALGADAVLVGRDLIRAAVGGGSAGVKLQMERLAAVLRSAMVMTGCADLKAIDRGVLVD